MLAAVARRRANPARFARESASEIVERAWDVSCTFRVSLAEARRALSSMSSPETDPLNPPPCASTFPAYVPREHFRFELVHQSSRSAARVGRIHTPHGTIDTPAFVPVGTNAALKAVPHTPLMRDAGLDLMFANTYHLMLQPGIEAIERAGGLHAFMNRSSPLITDSGGFQIFSLGAPSAEDGDEMKSRRASKHKDAKGLIERVTERGVTFKSYRDGRTMELTPESSVHAQKALGADIIIPLDELLPYKIDAFALRKSVFRSHRWEARSLREHLNDVREQAMYAVIHGGVDDALRRLSAEYLGGLPFDGFAIGGSLGKDTAELLRLLSTLMPLLPADRPNHLLGIGDVGSIRGAVLHGVDTFDSTFPTRNARHGTLLTFDARRWGGDRFNVARREHAEALEPPDETCPCALCREHTVAYLHHLFRANEPIAVTLAATHNLHHMGRLMARTRDAILRDEI